MWSRILKVGYFPVDPRTFNNGFLISIIPGKIQILVFTFVLTHSGTCEPQTRSGPTGIAGMRSGGEFTNVMCLLQGHALSRGLADNRHSDPLPTHSLAHWPTHLLTQPPTHPMIWKFVLLVSTHCAHCVVRIHTVRIHLPICSPSHSPTHPPTCPVAHPPTYPPTHVFVLFIWCDVCTHCVVRIHAAHIHVFGHSGAGHAARIWRAALLAFGALAVGLATLLAFGGIEMGKRPRPTFVCSQFLMQVVDVLMGFALLVGII